MKSPLLAHRRHSAAGSRFPRCRVLASLAPLALLASCATPSAPPAPPAPPAATAALAEVPPTNLPADPNSPAQKLVKGLSAAEVRARLGAPLEIKTQHAAGIVSEIWFYQRTFPGKPRQVAAEMQEIPFVDPVTGVMRMIKEPVYKTEQTMVTEHTELLMIRGLLVEWRQTYTTDKKYY